ncbi:hypothetical protein EXIGLDRAFT_832327 [Exidia glandulosa HHB12029]|uniref:Uncharacterized protein n=1 Tax=Exidia glandulosa HHB12029 TaxID=1314781 RepID=A0A165LRS2_EXIGL|nr:hypothetical protein EXIGLDRAFT_832327 [Exidia glandulosa HHB12029]
MSLAVADAILASLSTAVLRKQTTSEEWKTLAEMFAVFAHDCWGPNDFTLEANALLLSEMPRYIKSFIPLMELLTHPVISYSAGRVVDSHPQAGSHLHVERTPTALRLGSSSKRYVKLRFIMQKIEESTWTTQIQALHTVVGNLGLRTAEENTWFYSKRNFTAENEAKLAQQLRTTIFEPACDLVNRLLEKMNSKARVQPRAQCKKIAEFAWSGERVYRSRVDFAIVIVSKDDVHKNYEGGNDDIPAAFIEVKDCGALSGCRWNGVAALSANTPIALSTKGGTAALQQTLHALPQVVKYAVYMNCWHSLLIDGHNAIFMEWRKKRSTIAELNAAGKPERVSYVLCSYLVIDMHKAAEAKRENYAELSPYSVLVLLLLRALKFKGIPITGFNEDKKEDKKEGPQVPDATHGDDLGGLTPAMANLNVSVEDDGCITNNNDEDFDGVLTGHPSLEPTASATAPAAPQPAATNQKAGAEKDLPVQEQEETDDEEESEYESEEET